MMEDLSTHRLTLRRRHMEDAEKITALVNDPRIYLNVARIPAGQTLEETKAYLEASLAGEAEGKAFGFAVERHGELVGLVAGGAAGGDGAGLPGVLDVGYWFTPEVWGHGFATEAMAAFLRWLEIARHLRVFTAGYFVDNPGSGRVLRKLGFLPAGRTLFPCVGRGEKVETIEMVRIADAR